MCEGIDGDDNGIGQNVCAANQEESLLIFPWNLLGDLHHSEDDDQVCAGTKSVFAPQQHCQLRGETYIWGLRPAILKVGYVARYRELVHNRGRN